MSKQGALKFLEATAPFHFLDEGVIMIVANHLSSGFYPKDTVILTRNDPPSDFLFLIKSGTVKVYLKSEQNEDFVLDIKGEGENFGFLSLIGGNKQKTTVVALENTFCYKLKKEVVFRLIDSTPAIASYYLSYLARYLDRTFEEIHHKNFFSAGGDNLLFHSPVQELAVDLVSTGEETSIQEAAQLMARHKISSLVIHDRQRQPTGIITDQDLREKVIAQGRSILDPVKDIATPSLIQIEAGESCFEALVKMVQHNIHRLLVADEGRLKGIITNHDLMLLQGTSPLSFAKDITEQETLEGLISLSRKTNNVAGLLVKQNARLNHSTRIITEINDRLMGKVLELSEKETGPPPLSYCFFVYGSSGRKEQTFKTDQDNAIIYADPQNEKESKLAQAYFHDFASRVNKTLNRVGFPLCAANYMAGNPEWCRPVQDWKHYYTHWVSEPVPDSLLKFLVFFDLRPIYGAFSLVEGLREYFFHLIKDQRVFFGHMANLMLKITPPLGFFKQFAVEKEGAHKDKFDLKVKGLSPLLDAVRLFAMETGIKETSTLERIALLKDRHGIVKEFQDEITQAFEYIMLLRMRHQYEQIKAGKTPDNFVDPEQLTNLEKKILKDAFVLMQKIQGLIMERYKQMMV
jgi:CBS domain-containing protein